MGIHPQRCLRTASQGFRLGRTVVCAAIGGIIVAASSVAHGQGRTVIKTDSSWGRAAGAVARTGGPTVLLGNSSRDLTVRGDVYTITQQQGRTAGLNLFHSFESFSIGPGDAVVFTTNSANLQNVISRVQRLIPNPH